MSISTAVLQFWRKLFGETKRSVETPRIDTRNYERKYYLQHVPRFYGQGAPPAGHWGPCHPSTMKVFKAQFTCSAGHALTLTKHFVASDGRVYPSIVCRAPGCAYHEIVQLDDWTFGEVGSPDVYGRTG